VFTSADEKTPLCLPGGGNPTAESDSKDTTTSMTRGGCKGLAARSTVQQQRAQRRAQQFGLVGLALYRFGWAVYRLAAKAARSTSDRARSARRGDLPSHQMTSPVQTKSYTIPAIISQVHKPVVVRSRPSLQVVSILPSNTSDQQQPCGDHPDLSLCSSWRQPVCLRPFPTPHPWSKREMRLHQDLRPKRICAALILRRTCIKQKTTLCRIKPRLLPCTAQMRPEPTRSAASTRSGQTASCRQQVSSTSHAGKHWQPSRLRLTVSKARRPA
jgi:hypothetical protein